MKKAFLVCFTILVASTAFGFNEEYFDKTYTPNPSDSLVSLYIYRFQPDRYIRTRVIGDIRDTGTFRLKHAKTTFERAVDTEYSSDNTIIYTIEWDGETYTLEVVFLDEKALMKWSFSDQVEVLEVYEIPPI